MDKHSLKKLAVFLGSSICVLQIAVIPVMANVSEENNYLWKSLAPEGETSVEDTATPRARGDILNKGYVRLSNVDGKAAIYGETLGNFVSLDEVGLELYLEKYDGTTFNSYKDWSYVDYNTSDIAATFLETVEKGYCYCLRGYHYVIDDDLYEAVSTTTNGLPIK